MEERRSSPPLSACPATHSPLVRGPESFTAVRNRRSARLGRRCWTVANDRGRPRLAHKLAHRDPGSPGRAVIVPSFRTLGSGSTPPVGDVRDWKSISPHAVATGGTHSSAGTDPMSGRSTRRGSSPPSDTTQWEFSHLHRPETATAGRDRSRSRLPAAGRERRPAPAGAARPPGRRLGCHPADLLDHAPWGAANRAAAWVARAGSPAHR